RPGRYWVTSDGLVILASEVGVLDIEPTRVVRRGRLQPGRIFLADTAAGRIVEDEEVKAELAAQLPYQDWLYAGLIHLDDLPARGARGARGRGGGAGGGGGGAGPPPGGGGAPGGRPPGGNQPCSPSSGRSGTPRRSSGSPSRRWRGPARSRSARWAPTRRWPCSRTARGSYSTTSLSCSRR